MHALASRDSPMWRVTNDEFIVGMTHNSNNNTFDDTGLLTLTVNAKIFTSS